jgi:alkyl sulfatase BDS1-like metallo-beta-lactamase superfamily hydrolase
MRPIRAPVFRRAAATAGLLAAVVGGCGRPPDPPRSAGGGLSPEAHRALVAAHDWSDPPAFADATRGLVAAPRGQIRADDGRVVWDFDAFDFLTGEPPLTAHPGLWRHARLNNNAGLFVVTDGIWQLRGFDLANLTLIEGETGWIVVDPLTTRETAAFALAFARRHLGDRPVSALVYTHCHVDHFGGALGVVTAAEAAERRIPIVAPAGFMEEATSETVLAGNAMGRRALYQFGRDLPRSPADMIDGGLGKTVALGRIGILPPTIDVAEPEREMVIDGVRFVFHNVPGSEAPAEFTFTLPDRRAYCGAELLTHTLHNVITPRGAKPRDALRWARYMDEALAHTADADVFFASHHWPVWGTERIREFIAAQRDAMKYLHDQTVRLFNAGLNADEIAEQLRLPPALDACLHVHGYYGTLRHNVRGVYQHYLSHFDGNPATLDQLPRAEVGRRLVALAGGADEAVAAAHAAADAGDLRWAAQLLDGVLRAEPDHAAARSLLAETYRRLGHAAESATWRNFYLTGARELVAGPPAEGVSRTLLSDMLLHTPVERFLEAMAASLDGPRAEGVNLTINLVFSDTGEVHVLRLERSVLWPRKAAAPAAGADATLTLTKPFFVRMMTGDAGAMDLLLSGDARIEGSTVALGRFFGLLTKAPTTFPIVPAPPP